MRLVILAMFAVGCGSNAMTPADSGAPDAADARADAPIVYCSSTCGTVDAGADGGVPCKAGEICGERGIPGFSCCDPTIPEECNPGNPAPGDCP